MHTHKLCEEQLWNDEYLQPTMKDWDIGVVLCLYKPETSDVLRRLVSLWGNKVDKYFGNIKRGKRYSLKQRVEKVPSLDFGEERRGWHANVVLRKPDHVSNKNFLHKLLTLWLEVLSIRYNREFTENLAQFELEKKAIVYGEVVADSEVIEIKLAWSEIIGDGFKVYASRKRTLTAELMPGVDSPNDLIVHEALVIHSTQ